MSRDSNINQTCSRLCLLTTLLFLLCIYIKRVNATSCSDISNISSAYSSSNPLAHPRPLKGLDLGTRVTYEKELNLELECPYEKAIRIKSSIKNSAKREVATRLRDEMLKQAKLCSWMKDRAPVHRDNGNPIDQVPGDEFRLTLLLVGVSDAGQYSCTIGFPSLHPNETDYLIVYESLTITLAVESRATLDIKPIIYSHPTEQFRERGANATFECKSVATLLTKSTHWFKSNCSSSYLSVQNQTECLESFHETFKSVQSTKDTHLLNDYVIPEYNHDQLNLVNVSQSDVGYYGCYVFNGEGLDIRLGSLKLLELQETRDQPKVQVYSPNYILYGIIIILSFLFLLMAILHVRCNPQFGKKKSEHHHNLIAAHAPIVGDNCKEVKLRQHLPIGDCPDIYSVGKTLPGFFSGHLLHENGHLMAQSICSGILNKEKNPSISSNSNSDEASSSDNSRSLYLHTSNTTTTTVPMYDHPPTATNTTTRHFGAAIVQDACVINPTYGFLRPETDVTDWIFPRRNLQRLNKIGEGQFGEVWRYIARHKDGNENYVAVKQLKNRAGLGDRERLELIAEIEIMKLVNNHPNVIKLLHYCLDDYEPLLLIMEYAEIGKLQTYLRNCRSFRNPYSCTGFGQYKATVTSKELIKFSYHIAKGMEYVASRGLVHRDLASRNILVSKDKVCKVADFGFARRVNDECAYERTTTSPVPVKWMAPEALVENKFTTKSDVFSFGILMWEIVTLGATPYEYLTSSEVYKKVTTGGRLERPAHCSEEFYKIMSSCWLHNPASRPNFKELAYHLEKLLLSDKDYIELDQYPEHAYYNILNVAEKEIVCDLLKL